MTTRFLITLLLILSSLHVDAQTFYKITHLSGTKSYNVNNVTVLPINSPTTNSQCGVGPYVVGEGYVQNSYKIIFSIPVHVIQVNAAYLGSLDTIGIKINGSFYNVSTAELKHYTGGNCGLSPCAVVGNGLITNAFTGNTSGGANIEIDPSYLIDTVEVFYKGGTMNGAAFSVAYGTIPKVYTGQIQDTFLCAGDSVEIPYYLSDTFKTGNVFTAELSDENGSFAAPQAIGSINTSGFGGIWCVVPVGIKESNKYRIRVRASLPADIALPNNSNITISAYPQYGATTNSPVCNGKTLDLKYEGADTAIKYNWMGPDGFSSKDQNTSLIVSEKSAGQYFVTASKIGCTTYDTLVVNVKHLPRITNISNTGPVCIGEPVDLRADADITGATFFWSGPGGFNSTDRNPHIQQTSGAADGAYSVSATYDGCISDVTSTYVKVNPKPDLPLASTTINLKPGEDCQLLISNIDSRVVYFWTGPAGFVSYAPDTIIREVSAENEGTYVVTADLNGCEASTSVFLRILAAQTSFTMSPNPVFSGVMKIKGNLLALPEMQIDLLNINGGIVYSTVLQSTKKFLDVDIQIPSTLTNGIYFVRMKLKDEVLTARFVVGR